MTNFTVALKPSPFTRSHFKRWQAKTISWLTTMGVHWVAGCTSRDPLSHDWVNAFTEATVLFVGVFLGVPGDKLVDAYLHIPTCHSCYAG
jgi:hypothetical protein